MDRTQLFDKLLLHRYKNQKGFANILSICEEEYGLNDRALLESILEEMIARDLVKQTTYDRFSIKINYNGRQLIDTYGSYSSFLKSEKLTQKRKQRSKITPTVVNIGIAIIFGTITAIFSWLNYSKKEELKNKNIEIIYLKKTIDSLLIETTKKDSINLNHPI